MKTQGASKDVVFLAPAASKKADIEKFLRKYPFKYQVIPNASMIIRVPNAVASIRAR